MTPATRTDAVITARGLQRGYGTGKDAHVAVAGIDLTVHRGELFALLGTNGAGKTSTLEVLEGLATASAGSVTVLGHDPITGRDAVRPRQGLMLQTGGFPADLTVRESLSMWCSTLSRPRSVPELLAEVELAERADTRISSLSGGEVRRLDLACAIAGDPELLFLDEPTTGLDPESRARAQRLIRELRDRGTTIVLTTHYLDEAELLADRIAIMHRGRIVREGTLAEVVAGHDAVIRFARPTPGVALPELGSTAAITTHPARGDGRVEITTSALQADLGALLQWAQAEQIELRELDARAPSLETVFLGIAEKAATPRGAAPSSAQPTSTGAFA